MATRVPPPPGKPKTNIFKTPGVSNVEKAYQNAGATETYTPAFGGTVQGGTAGRRDDTAMRKQAAEGTQLPKKFANQGVGDEQRPVQPTWIGRQWHRFKYGNVDGK